jgi:hypothetical protein
MMLGLRVHHAAGSSRLIFCSRITEESKTLCDHTIKVTIDLQYLEKALAWCTIVNECSIALLHRDSGRGTSRNTPVSLQLSLDS